MATFGYRVTVVEIAPGPKKGGTPVNIQDRTIDIVKRMGLLDQIREQALKMEVMEFRNADDVTERSSIRPQHAGNDAHDEYEIERDVLLAMLFDAVKDHVEFIFGDSIQSLTDETHQVAVSFRGGKPRAFDLVIGCDGVHSTVRRLCFGDEAQFLRYLGAYFSITIVDKSLIPDNTTQIYNEPGIAVMLNAYNQKTDICLCFQSEDEIPYDYRNEEDQRRIMAERLADVGWRTPALLAEVRRSDNFYFDKLCHTTMPSWTKGRIALVGDAAYCPSPAAGRGGSLAIDGAAALADAFVACAGDVEQAFEHYNRSFRPFVDRIQAEVIEVGLEFFIPRTAEAIRERNAGMGPMV
ncbi:2-polyprenyl-6-methoxyphenol hydroxylase-like FAD-dependent oxidoreductase [Rhodanobacter sp. ANJX3]|nr:2-polyprenyl-6-methoxyphenol hydroxylase-like FAD-dependent oxidoreductase [Rhodanobacter sp. ANJX3]